MITPIDNGQDLLAVIIKRNRGPSLDHSLGSSLSCYISHSAMHRKKADFDPALSEPKPLKY